MDAALLFTLCNWLVLPAWLLLILLPSWRWTQRLVSAVWIPVLLGIAYAYAFYQAQPTPENGGFGSLAAVMILFSEPWVMVAGWIHYLVFDLFVGAWQLRDSKRHGIPHFWIVPCLLLTFMLGPVGLLSYLILRLIINRMTSLDENFAKP
ncbi:ABA4-like family protein [Arenicella xantha]|uniref:Uncharacterized protein DUF4281 n=1 Tax=Arenicella xantha TaxID=644221 RepID=A0A395JL42_9GAMM|nr:ABA4-like family protein [Arenicella xantha]RBP49688.1 uncharacterized protein DUF4281 [Arenicella xantha]